MSRLSVMVVCVALTLVGCDEKQVLVPQTATGSGKTKFDTYCAGCHVDDAVTSGPAPTLESSPWVTGPEGRSIRIVLHGVGGPIQVADKAYDLTMPGFAPVLMDADIASLLTYVRSRFGGINTPISGATVGRIRAVNQGRQEYWTVAELLMLQ